MNGPAVIYTVKPVFKIPEKLDLPVCMYRMKNPVARVMKTKTKTNDQTDDDKEILAGIVDKVKDILKKPSPELADLEKRWDSVLQQLEDLKSQVASIRNAVTDIYKLSGCPMLDTVTLNKLKDLNGTVINADPSSPPYSLLLIKNLYKTSIPIVFSSHVHSTVSSLPENLSCFNEIVPQTNNVLKMHLIWKNDILDTELITNPVKQLPIRGEVNILRYFARIGLELLHYPAEELIDTLNMDSVLDLCHRLLHVKTSKEKASVLKSLNAKLGRSVYFGGNDINICDISLWSVLKQSNVNVSQELTPNMAKWFNKMNKNLF